ncbi:MAG: RagB/SusD family nutrient uptake outer membrane protein, partial [Bacteroidales bacterium]|nr:RagB/SusD family nutrient uptake outer membrane protein [Bacteroidales bacterium]
YLIAAEAYARRGQAGDAEKACEYLNALREARIPEYEANSYTGETLLNEVKKERVKELFGEGFRLTDLKRWGQGFSRSAAQDVNIITQAGSTQYELLSMPASENYWLWPIPQAEIDANPQIKDQQNPGF